ILRTWPLFLPQRTAAMKMATLKEEGKKAIDKGLKLKKRVLKALMAIDGLGWDWSYMENEEDHALVADGEAPI
nr:hypothetical protein [Tanacetum cinerariifolium]